MSEIYTSVNIPISSRLLNDYFHNLVNRFFKILPMRESEEASLSIYIDSLQSELLGGKDLIPSIRDDSRYLTLLMILEFLKREPSPSVKEVKREVFRAISVCNQLEAMFAEEVIG